jgi:hypothetical protein
MKILNFWWRRKIYRFSVRMRSSSVLPSLRFTCYMSVSFQNVLSIFILLNFSSFQCFVGLC